MRIQATIPDSVFDALSKIEERKVGPDVIREALRVYLWIKKNKKEGKEIGVLEMVDDKPVLRYLIDLAD